MNDCPQGLSRRFACGLLAGVIVYPTLYCTTPRQTHNAASLIKKITSLFSDRRNVNTIGAACLNALPFAERKLPALAAELCLVTSYNALAGMSKDAVRRQILDQVCRDFAQGHVINVNGWLLALTEARVYALVSLA